MGKDYLILTCVSFLFETKRRCFCLVPVDPIPLKWQVRLALMKQALLVFKTRLLEQTLLNHQQLLQQSVASGFKMKLLTATATEAPELRIPYLQTQLQSLLRNRRMSNQYLKHLNLQLRSQSFLARSCFRSENANPVSTEASSDAVLISRSTEQPVATREVNNLHVLAEHVETLHLLVYEM